MLRAFWTLSHLIQQSSALALLLRGNQVIKVIHAPKVKQLEVRDLNQGLAPKPIFLTTNWCNLGSRLTKIIFFLEYLYLTTICKTLGRVGHTHTSSLNLKTSIGEVHNPSEKLRHLPENLFKLCPLFGLCFLICKMGQPFIITQSDPAPQPPRKLGVYPTFY